MKARARQGGVAAIEFAILLVPLLIMTFGLTELGRAFYYYGSVVKSTRAAARYLSTQLVGAGYAEARCIAVYGQTTCTGDALVPGLTTDMVNIVATAGVETGAGALDMVKVEIQGFPFVSYVPFVIKDIAFAPISTSMRQGTS